MQISVLLKILVLKKISGRGRGRGLKLHSPSPCPLGTGDPGMLDQSTGSVSPDCNLMASDVRFANQSVESTAKMSASAMNDGNSCMPGMQYQYSDNEPGWLIGTLLTTGSGKFCSFIRKKLFYTCGCCFRVDCGDSGYG